MGQENSERVSHKLTDAPNWFRDDQVNQILNDLCEEDTGKGFSEVAYVGATPFVDKITTWDSPAKTKKRTDVQFSYSPQPFLSTIVKRYYDEETGLAVVATTTATVTYNTNKSVKDVDVTVTRP